MTNLKQKINDTALCSVDTVDICFQSCFVFNINYNSAHKHTIHPYSLKNFEVQQRNNWQKWDFTVTKYFYRCTSKLSQILAPPKKTDAIYERITKEQFTTHLAS